MKRRSFLSLLGAAAVGSAVAPLLPAAPAEIVSAEPTWTRAIGMDWAEPTKPEYFIVSQNHIYSTSMISRVIELQHRYNAFPPLFRGQF